MIKLWVLFVLTTAGDLEAVEFASKTSCESAKAAIIGWIDHAKAMCIGPDQELADAAHERAKRFFDRTPRQRSTVNPLRIPGE